MMRDYEKLIVLLETQNIDVSNFKKLKKNELLLLGSKEITEETSFLSLVNEQHKLVNPLVGYSNPFFMNLGSKKYSASLEETQIYHYKDKSIQSIYNIMQNDELIDTQKHDVVYRGFQQLCNEYKFVLENTARSDLEIINSHIKLTEAKEQKFINKSIKKYNNWCWLLSLLMVLFNYYVISKATVEGLYVISYNVVFYILIFFPFLKISYFYYLNNESGREQKEIKVIKKHYENLIQINDKHIEQFEKDLYRYYSNPEKNITINYLKKTNQQFKNVRNYMNKFMKRSLNQKTKKFILKLNAFVNFIAPISALLLIILFFILR